MKSKQLSILVALLLVVGLTSCMNNFNDEASDMAAKNDQDIRAYLTANQLLNEVKASPTGLYYIITPASSTAKQATATEELEFTYVLSYISGDKAIVVDSTNKTKSAYIPFLRGVVISGLEEGLSMMKEGQKARFFIPSNIGFGKDDRDNKMPPYSAVIFDVELKRSRTEKQQIEDYALVNKLGTPNLIVPSEITGNVDSVRIYKKTNGTGAKIARGNTVTVTYTANSLRGTTPFDKSDSLTFKVGSGQYITGFDRGIAALSVGDKALLVFPSAIGYGSQGSYDQIKGYYTVPPYTPLAFEVTVKSAKQ